MAKKINIELTPDQLSTINAALWVLRGKMTDKANRVRIDDASAVTTKAFNDYVVDLANGKIARGK